MLFHSKRLTLKKTRTTSNMGCLLEFIAEILVGVPAELLGETLKGKIKDKTHNKALRVVLYILLALVLIALMIGLLCLCAFLIEWFAGLFEQE